mgnify:CR=1 FL=1
MNIAWFTVRKWSDFCSTTTKALAEGLVSKKHHLTIINADPSGTHDSFDWDHVALDQSKVPGRGGSSLARNAVRWMVQNEESAYDIVMIDWPLASKLAAIAAKKGSKVVLMDRSPPADVTLLGRMQWKVWRKAWNLVRNGTVQQGFVVSKAHQEFVMQKCNVDKRMIHPLPAGVDLREFTPVEKEFNGVWKMVYHGRLDKHRGVLALPMLLSKLKSQGINAELSLVGEGNAYSSLQRIAAHDESITLSPPLTKKAMAIHLQEQHIGLLPMPNTPVWSLASPLKRSEYLASGLLVYGVNHKGHTLEKTQESWYCLSEIETFHETAISWLTGMSETELKDGSRSAREYAESHCSWEETISRLETIFQSVKLDV